MPNNASINPDNKKKIVYIIIPIIIIIVVAIVTVVIIKSINDNNSNSSKSEIKVLTAKEKADAQTNDAVSILHSDPVKSKELLLQLLQKYKDLNDTNGVINVESQLYYLDHEVKN